jgi:uncharacterized protein (TIGR02145 family)
MIIKVNESGYVPIRPTSILEGLRDIDGNKYTTVIINNQEWIVENLRVTHYADGIAISNLIVDNTYNDWFLPSIDELNLMYTELYLYGVGNLWNNKYWSSSEVDANNALVLAFDSGSYINWSKASVAYTRPIRYFVTTAEYSLREIGPARGWICYKINLGAGLYGYYEAASIDLSSTYAWSNITDVAVTGTGTALGTGLNNTTLIIAQFGHINSVAKRCNDYIVNGWVDDITGAYCEYNNDVGLYVNPFGYLYNWYAINNVNELVYFARNGVQETGWRVPTSADYTTLSNFLGVTVGGKLKETGIVHWNTPNTGATNETGFTFLGGGYRDNTGPYFAIKNSGLVWTSTDAGGVTAFSRNAGFNTSDFSLAANPKSRGFSVRCVRDI